MNAPVFYISGGQIKVTDDIQTFLNATADGVGYHTREGAEAALREHTLIELAKAQDNVERLKKWLKEHP